MPYACPVCGAVEADAEHLANHLAVTASLHGGDHEAWLEDHAPDWGGRSPPELGAIAAEHARERAGKGDADDPDRRRDPPSTASGGRGRPPGIDPGAPDRREVARDPETERILREARELTRRAESDREDDPDG
jgi:hypothetical protein